jgi:phosphohistidine phosphatase
MRLYFLRHGPAESREGWERPDADRPLTERGIKVTRRVAQRVVELDLGLDAILTSPFTRALETARIVVDALDDESLLAEEQGLEPGRFSPGELHRIVDEHAGAKNLMLVGHEPSMTDVAGDLVGGARLRLKKSGLIRIDVEDPASHSGELVWLVPPKVL